VTQWVFAVVDRLGEVGIGLLIFLENVVPPVPSEVILPLAGFRASAGALNLPLTWLAATVGSVLGAVVLYGLGAWLGYDRLHALAGRRWFVISSQSDLDRGQRIFRRHGGKIVLLGRCIPVVRSLVSIPAGIDRMPLPRFLLLTALGSGVWNALFIGLGWYLGDRWDRVQGWLGPVTYVVLALAAAGLVWLAVRKVRHHRAQPARQPVDASTR
jgi:membrane protein DedA with SNARE-associated domain